MKTLEEETFLRWVNSYLPSDSALNDLETGFNTGLNFVALCESLTSLKAERLHQQTKFVFHKIANINSGYVLLKKHDPIFLKDVLPDAKDIVEGKLKEVLGLVFLLIRCFQLVDTKTSTRRTSSFSRSSAFAAGNSGYVKTELSQVKSFLFDWIRQDLDLSEADLPSDFSVFEDGKYLGQLLCKHSSSFVMEPSLPADGSFLDQVLAAAHRLYGVPVLFSHVMLTTARASNDPTYDHCFLTYMSELVSALKGTSRRQRFKRATDKLRAIARMSLGAKNPAEAVSDKEQKDSPPTPQQQSTSTTDAQVAEEAPVETKKPGTAVVKPGVETAGGPAAEGEQASGVGQSEVQSQRQAYEQMIRTKADAAADQKTKPLQDHRRLRGLTQMGVAATAVGRKQSEMGTTKKDETATKLDEVLVKAEQTTAEKEAVVPKSEKTMMEKEECVAQKNSIEAPAPSPALLVNVLTSPPSPTIPNQKPNIVQKEESAATKESLEPFSTLSINEVTSSPPSSVAIQKKNMTQNKEESVAKESIETPTPSLALPANELTSPPPPTVAIHRIDVPALQAAVKTSLISSPTPIPTARGGILVWRRRLAKRRKTSNLYLDPRYTDCDFFPPYDLILHCSPTRHSSTLPPYDAPEKTFSSSLIPSPSTPCHGLMSLIVDLPGVKQGNCAVACDGQSVAICCKREWPFPPQANNERLLAHISSQKNAVYQSQSGAETIHKPHPDLTMDSNLHPIASEVVCGVVEEAVSEHHPVGRKIQDPVDAVVQGIIDRAVNNLSSPSSRTSPSTSPSSFPRTSLSSPLPPAHSSTIAPLESSSLSRSVRAASPPPYSCCSPCGLLRRVIPLRLQRHVRHSHPNL